MFHISKQNVSTRMQEKHLLKVNGFEIMLFNFLLIIMNRFLRKPVLVRNSLCYLFWHWFLTLSVLHRKLAIQICFCKVAGDYRKKLLSENVLSYQKGIPTMDVFLILQLYRSVRLRRKWFSGENEERETTLLQET